MSVASRNIFYSGTLRSIKGDDCCSSITYSSLQTDNGALYVTDLYLYRLDCCGERVLICTKLGVSSTTVGPVVFDENIGDGSYVLVVSHLNVLTDITYTLDLEVCLTCCEKKRSSLVCSLKKKMSDLSCKINQYQSVGRRYVNLNKSYLKLSNILYVLNERSCCGMLIPMTCEEVEKLSCLIQTIK